jgi:hypothetical protein
VADHHAPQWHDGGAQSLQLKVEVLSNDLFLAKRKKRKRKRKWKRKWKRKRKKAS